MAYDYVPKSSRSAQGGLTTNEAGTLLVTCGGADAISATTKYLTYVGGNHASAQVCIAVVPEGYTNIHSMRLVTTTAPASTDTYVATVQQSTDNGANWTDTTLTVTNTGTTKSGADVTHVPTVAAGYMLAVKGVSSGSTAAGVTVSFIVS